MSLILSPGVGLLFFARHAFSIVSMLSFGVVVSNQEGFGQCECQNVVSRSCVTVLCSDLGASVCLSQFECHDFVSRLGLCDLACISWRHVAAMGFGAAAVRLVFGTTQHIDTWNPRVGSAWAHFCVCASVCLWTSGI